MTRPPLPEEHLLRRAQPPATDRDAIALLLDEHQAMWTDDLMVMCDCGERFEDEEEHRAHVADELHHALTVHPAPVCDTCGGDGEALTMVPGSTGEPVEGMVPCPDCVAPRPRNDGIARPAPDTLADRVQAVLDDHEAIEDFTLSDADYEAMKRCYCAHCKPGDGICPQAVWWLVGEHLRALRDRVADALLAGRSDASPEGGAG